MADRNRQKVDGSTMDLTAREEGTDHYAVGIVSALNPEEYNINIAEVLT